MHNWDVLEIKVGIRVSHSGSKMGSHKHWEDTNFMSRPTKSLTILDTVELQRSTRVV